MILPLFHFYAVLNSVPLFRMLLAALCNELHSFTHTAAVWLFLLLLHLAPVWVINGRKMKVILLSYSCIFSSSSLETTK